MTLNMNFIVTVITRQAELNKLIVSVHTALFIATASTEKINIFGVKREREGVGVCQYSSSTSLFVGKQFCLGVTQHSHIGKWGK